MWMLTEGTGAEWKEWEEGMGLLRRAHVDSEEITHVDTDGGTRAEWETWEEGEEGGRGSAPLEAGHAVGGDCHGDTSLYHLVVQLLSLCHHLQPHAPTRSSCPHMQYSPSAPLRSHHASKCILCALMIAIRTHCPTAYTRYSSTVDALTLDLHFKEHSCCARDSRYLHACIDTLDPQSTRPTHMISIVCTPTSAHLQFTKLVTHTIAIGQTLTPEV